MKSIHSAPPPGGMEDVGGRGLRLVAQSATRWGVTCEHGGRVAVWFELSERTFREYARSLMAERGISLRRLAKIISYDQGYLSRVLNGHRPPSRRLVARVDDALGANGGLIALTSDGSPDAEAEPTTAPQMAVR